MKNKSDLIIKELGDGYPPRTIHNATNASLTVAFACDFKTAGEQLTKKVSKNYVSIPLGLHPNYTENLDLKKKSFDSVVLLNNFNTPIINIAGNTLSTLLINFITQERINLIVFDFLSEVYPKCPKLEIVCGGQTGADIAGAVAGVTMGLRTVVTMPLGFMDERGKHTEDHIRSLIKGMSDNLKTFR